MTDDKKKSLCYSPGQKGTCMNAKESKHAPFLRELGFKSIPNPNQDLVTIFNTRVVSITPTYLCIDGRHKVTYLKDERGGYWYADVIEWKRLEDKGFSSLSYLWNFQSDA